MESCPLWIFPCTRLRLAMPEAEQTVVGVLKGGTGFRENLRRKKPFSLKAIYLDVSLSAPQKMGHAPNIIFVVSKMANFRNWGTDWDTSGFFLKIFSTQSIPTVDGYRNIMRRNECTFRYGRISFFERLDSHRSWSFPRSIQPTHKLYNTAETNAMEGCGSGIRKKSSKLPNVWLSVLSIAYLGQIPAGSCHFLVVLDGRNLYLKIGRIPTKQRALCWLLPKRYSISCWRKSQFLFRPRAYLHWYKVIW